MNLADEIRAWGAAILLGWVQALWPRTSRHSDAVHRMIGELARAMLRDNDERST